jgi:16S rRNA (uracil1498-N3)-methyltransferase
MECLFAPDMTIDAATVLLLGDEAQHARALRLRVGERLLLSNGHGLCAETEVQEISKDKVVCGVVRILPEHSEYPFRIIVALGILDNRERMEFALEKAIELGARDFVLLLTDNSERDRTKPERLQSKALAALKQAHRAHLPTIHAPMSPKALLEMLPAGTHLILADAEGSAPHSYQAGTVCLCVGAEGGFSQDEQQLFRNDPRTNLWKLAPTRLRAETALLCGVAALTLFHELSFSE